MSVYYDAKKKIFRLETKNSTYLIGLSLEGYVGHIYYGDKLNGEVDNYLLRMEEAPFTPSVNKREKASFLDFFPMEFPTGGIGDYRESCLNVRNEQGCMGSELFYASHRIYSGKRKLEGLPSSFGEENEVQTLEIVCEDSVIGLEVHLSYSAFEKEDVIARSVWISNKGREKLKIEKIYSACLDMDNENFEILSL
ncbi:MAG: glycoside hydrolase family 36 N-terminal domain-containing protein, partial [Blautia sp.]|nr:glycoside hydrolase family 36 N-terminal domain-containing protein [Blautia sp.]